MFRGVVVADSPLGVRVVSVEERSQAAFADVRPEDLILQIDGRMIRSIDEFAVLSQGIQGRQARADVAIVRNGEPRHLLLHVYSYPILQAWEIAFVPDHDLRFVDRAAALAYWMRMGRGFLEARDLSGAVNAYLNALHYDPENTELALVVEELSWNLAAAAFNADQTARGLAMLRRSMHWLERLFDKPLTTDQLVTVREQLRQTVDTLRRIERLSRSAHSRSIVKVLSKLP